MYEKTVTVFSHYVNGSIDEWYATVLHGVDLIIDKSVIVSRFGADSKDKGVLHIGISGGEIQGNKYLDPKEWRNNPSEGITFQTGEIFDFILEGEWDGDKVVTDGNYTNGFYNHMNKTNDRVFSLSSVTRYTLIPHFEITVK